MFFFKREYHYFIKKKLPTSSVCYKLCKYMSDLGIRHELKNDKLNKSIKASEYYWFENCLFSYILRSSTCVMMFLLVAKSTKSQQSSIPWAVLNHVIMGGFQILDSHGL